MVGSLSSIVNYSSSASATDSLGTRTVSTALFPPFFPFFVWCFLWVCFFSFVYGMSVLVDADFWTRASYDFEDRPVYCLFNYCFEFVLLGFTVLLRIVVDVRWCLLAANEACDWWYDWAIGWLVRFWEIVVILLQLGSAFESYFLIFRLLPRTGETDTLLLSFLAFFFGVCFEMWLLYGFRFWREVMAVYDAHWLCDIVFRLALLLEFNRAALSGYALIEVTLALTMLAKSEPVLIVDLRLPRF